MRDFARIGEMLGMRGLDGWLLYDFRGSNPTAVDVLELRGTMRSRRFFAWIDRKGKLTLVIHRIEQQPFEELPGERRLFASFEELKTSLGKVLAGAKRIAMEYCPLGTIPYLSRVDAGTLELVRSFGVAIESSADLVQELLCVLTGTQRFTHAQAAELVDRAKDDAFARIQKMLRRGDVPTELHIQRFLMGRFEAFGIETDHAPIVAVGPHSGNPHYAPSEESNAPIERDRLVLIDLWGKLKHPEAVYADITWVGYTGSAVPEKVLDVFHHVIGARDAALELIRLRKDRRQRVLGCEADRAARAVIERGGYGAHFIHRTGHNIGAASDHGDGANLDDFETHDDRELLNGTCFSIEPGIYLPEFGIRSEIDVFLDDNGVPNVYTPMQTGIVDVG